MRDSDENDTKLYLLHLSCVPHLHCFNNNDNFFSIYHPLQVIFIQYKSGIATAIRGL